MDLNTFIGIGRLTKDPDLAYGQSGKEYCNFSIAVNTGFGDKKETSFFNCIVFGKQAETLTKYFKKGQRVGIRGELKQETWEKDGQKRTSVKIIVQNIYFIETKSASPGSPAKTPLEEDKQDVPTDNPFSDGEIPF